MAPSVDPLDNMDSLEEVAHNGVRTLPVSFAIKFHHLKSLELKFIPDVAPSSHIDRDLKACGPKRDRRGVGDHALRLEGVENTRITFLGPLENQWATYGHLVMNNADSQSEQVSHPCYTDQSTLERLLALRTTRLGCRMASGIITNFPSVFSQLLSSPTFPSTIEQVQMTIDWVDGMTGMERGRFSPEWLYWTELDNALANSDVHPTLNTVELTIRMGDRWNVEQ
ncbi:unnamed protein product [Cyclocybe aegerita]|uniref:Uncharacterized protein n=1 Tax=Cyclocybe aegerita TaxID=1973307 RepID=A0A8S0VTL1_CYCAE|nr:unnamed protein product [Cyclocybe aegerita]